MRDKFKLTHEVIQKADLIRQQMLSDADVGKFVDQHRPEIPIPHLGKEEIKLVIIGQDPTAGPDGDFVDVKTVLRLDRSGPLRRFVMQLCKELGVDLDKNIYATNACKCFLIDKPTSIAKDSGEDVLELSAALWIPLLRWELDQFPLATVVSLGQPVLSMLVLPGRPRDMRYYWGHTTHWRQGAIKDFRRIESNHCRLARMIHPFIHQPSEHGPSAPFYRSRRGQYIEFIRGQMG